MLTNPRTGVAAQVGRDIARLYTAAFCILYLVLYWPLRDLLPEKFMRDASKITEMMENTMGGTMAVSLDNTGSYTNTALILASIPESLLDVSINAVAILTTIIVCHGVRSWRGLAVLPIMLVPLWLTSLMATTKETIVVTLTMALLLVAYKVRRHWLALAIMTAAYVFYGLNIRVYYLLIIMVAWYAALVLWTPKNFRFYWAIPALVALFFIPEDVYFMLQYPRDSSYQWLAFGSQNIVRTLFDNPFPPTDFWNFIYNYGYAMALLNFPFWKFYTINEVILFINVVMWYSLTFVGLKHLKGPVQFLICLFLGHLLILPLFEPDLGSYLRHVSSVVIYLVPALRLIESRRAEKAALVAHGAPARA